MSPFFIELNFIWFFDWKSGHKCSERARPVWSDKSKSVNRLNVEIMLKNDEMNWAHLKWNRAPKLFITTSTAPVR